MERKTKIVCTIGPASASAAGLRGLIEAGMNVARLNFSHGTRDEHGRVIERVRALDRELATPIAVLQDLAGPKVRIGGFAEGAVELAAGAPFTLTARPVAGSAREVSVSYAGLPGEVRPGDRLLLADGRIELEVRSVAGADVACTVVVGGTLSAGKGVNVPSGLRGLPILDDDDLADLRFGLAHGVDWVGLSFVRSAEDVRTARRAIAEAGATVPVVAKIETGPALASFDAILAEADAIMIARGDLGIETPLARVPTVQKALIAAANRAAKPAITATQMLYSMVEAAHPTRAEVADVAAAVLDGSDAVMLSEETSIGRHPARAVATMASVALATEEADARAPAGAAPAGGESEAEALASTAATLAARLDADLIVTLTDAGSTARYVARARPRQPILALTPVPETYRRLALVRGVVPILVEDEDDRDAGVGAARRRGWAGHRTVFVSRDSIRWGTL